MKKIFYILLSLILIGCSQTVKLDNKVLIEFYSVKTCSACKAFKNNAIEYFEDRYGDKVTIKVYDIDEDSSLDKYNKVISQLKDFDEEYRGMTPFINIDGYMAYLGYNSGDEEEIAKDIEAQINGGNLSKELEGHRFLYR